METGGGVSFIIDEEFRDLIPPLSDAERGLLEASIVAHGCRDPLVVWHRKGEGAVLLDGHNRYDICTEHGLPFDTTAVVLPDRASAKAWIIRNQQGRRNLTSSQRAALAVELLEIEEERARERQGMRTDIVEEVPPSDFGKSRDKAAESFGTNPRYVSDAKRLRSEAPDLYTDVRGGAKSITKAKRELKEREREKEREKNRQLVTAATPPDPTDRFQTIVLDPPWDWGDEGDVDQMGRARPTYDTMSIDEVRELPVRRLADDNAHIYLWITNRSLPKGFDLLDAWGFRYITALTWVKPHFGMGNYFRGQSEHVLFGVRGSLPLLVRDQGTTFTAPRPGKHSAKPPEFYEIVERCSPGPWLEMFLRGEPRPGWQGWGAEAVA